MKRQTVYAGQVPLETDLLLTGKNVLTAIGHVLQDMLGTSTLFSGLACVPTAPAGMTVNVNPGRAYSLQAIDTGAWSSLSADAHQIMKQGILLDAQNFSCPAPGTAGFSINYLIQGAFQEVDTGSAVLPYYNASNPSQAYNGPNGTGTSQTTARDNTVQLQVKAGVAATTGSQITPTPDAGFNGLWVVTVPFGASTITSANISQYSGAPFLTASLLSMIQQSGLYAVATGTANAHVAAFSPPITTRTDGMVLRYKAPAANTGALTFNDGLGAVAVVGAAHAALQGGETAVNGDVWLQWNSSIGGGSYVLIDSTGGAVQVAPATQSQHAPQMGQVAGVVGSTRNLAMSVTAASATATLTADEIIVETALGGVRYCLPSFSKTINLATTGAGGMDTGTAAANGFLGLYAIYNPTTQTAALLGKMESGAALPSVYGGANMPSGYTASGLVAVVPISATAGQFASFSVVDRFCSIIENTVISSSTTSTTGGNTPITASGVPYSARKISGSISLTNTISANSIWQFFADANSTGKVQYSINTAASGGNLFGYANMPLSAPRTLRATTFTSTGSNSLAYILLSSSYEI
jgi:hypothetical protein